jgi:hypothetical protein
MSMPGYAVNCVCVLNAANIALLATAVGEGEYVPVTALALAVLIVIAIAFVFLLAYIHVELANPEGSNASTFGMPPVTEEDEEQSVRSSGPWRS